MSDANRIIQVHDNYYNFYHFDCVLPSRMMAYIVWEVNPELFDNLEFLRWYGLSWATGMFLAYLVMLRIYEQEHLSQSDLDRLTTYLVLGIIIGARLGHILFYDPIYYLNNPIEILPIRIEPVFQFTGIAGLASHGGFLGALFALHLYSKKYKKDILWTLDRLVIAGSLLGSFVRVGNLMNSEIIGMPTQVPWAFVFIRVDQIPRHPAQLYEAVFYLMISVLLFLLWRSGKVLNYKGFLFGLGLSLIFSQRFLIEFLKEDQVAFEEGLILNMGQILSLPLIIFGILMMIVSYRRTTY